MNLAGKVDTEKGESRRNENIQFNLIDNNALKELMSRTGQTATIIGEFKADRGYFGAEFGQAPREPLHLLPQRFSPLHGQLRYSHNNSIFSARSFFQVGDVKPARANSYGFNVGLPLWRGGSLGIDASQAKVRGSVNGNVLVPTPEERIPLTSDPQLLSVVNRYLGAYPAELPNRTDVNPRMLNTNAPQRINNDLGGIRFEQGAGPANRLAFYYQFTLQKLDNFQLIAGQNPDTTTRVHVARATWTRQWSPATAINVSAGFNRIGSLLVPEKNAVGPGVSFSMALTSLGPGTDIPINRAQNIFRYAGELASRRGDHSMYAGAEVSRQQLNGYEYNDHRGVLQFVNDFGRDGITNLRMGIPSWLYGAYGYIHRGYRQWQLAWYAGDQWRVTGRLSLNFGLRHEVETRPVEVNHLDQVPYPTDWNNLAPSFGFAYALPQTWGVLRAAYGIQFGQIFPVTYGQIRYNPPFSTMFQLRLPDLHRPMSELLRQGAMAGQPPRLTLFVPDLVTPYSQQYNFTWETRPSKYLGLQLGYVGSRSLKLFSMWFLNRAVPVPGIPQTFETIQQRRPNPKDGEHRTILNGSRGYFDAARVTAVLRPWRGLSGEVSYWLSKAITLGPDHLNTAQGSDAYAYYNASQFSIQSELRGPAGFDQPHAFLIRGSYEAHWPGGASGWLKRVFTGWTLGAVALLKSGTPFTVQTGSDAPGFGNVDGTSGDNPNLLDPSILGRTIGNPDTSRRDLPRSAFAYIAPADRSGNLGWNTFRKGGIANLNASLWRRFQIGQDRQITFRTESINFTNTPQFAAPGSRLVNPDFGYITNTLNDGRTFRFQLELGF